MAHLAKLSSAMNNRLASTVARAPNFLQTMSLVSCSTAKPSNIQHLYPDRKSAMDHLRSMAALRYGAAPWNIWGGRQLDLGRAAAAHMRGDTNCSPFVSLSKDASQLLLLPDDHNEYGAKAIAENAKELHTYTVPKVTTRTAEEIVAILESRLKMMNPI
ncbi:hypothetical protein [Bradyrhizobium pachyrhizi]|uniref:hypothetical protein n=1 Tax=Bradyrhizobium pachyrhizi TaxID=280333 RepID=UPI001FD4886B|nr:hypothetical protein [Bradyrhizobium pachyrhizi]